MNKQTGSVHGILIFLLVLVLAGALSFVFWQNFTEKNQGMNTSTPKSSTKLPSFKRTSQVPSNWKLYKNTKYSLSFSYPSNWTVKEDSKGNPSLFIYEIGMGSSVQNFDVVVGISDLSLEQAVDRFVGNGMFKDTDTSGGNEILSKTKLLFDGFSAYEIQYKNSTGVVRQYIVQAHGYTYELPSSGEASEDKTRATLLDSFHFE